MRRAPQAAEWETRSLIGYVLVAAVLALTAAWMLFGPVTQRVVDQREADLTAALRSSAIILSDSQYDLASTAQEIVEGASLRLTVIAPDGTVVADTASDPAKMENHLDRPEVREALAEMGTMGKDRRFSRTMGSDHLYVATGFERDGEPYVLRVSAPTSTFSRVIAGVRNAELGLLAIGVAIALFVAWTAVKFASRPVERLAQVRSEFVSNASHELKTPVAGIRLLAETADTLLEDGETEAAREFIKRIDEEAIRMQHLVTDLLDLSRLEAAVPMGETTDARSGIHAAVESFEPLYARHDLYLHFRDEAKLIDTCRIPMSAAGLRTVLDNLIDNAMKYTATGGVEIVLRADSKHVVISVEDTGIGIAEEDLPRIFERFFRVDRARARDSGGTGLGLAVTRHSVENAGGTVSVTSEVDVGTTFTLAFPRV